MRLGSVLSARCWVLGAFFSIVVAAVAAAAPSRDLTGIEGLVNINTRADLAALAA